MRTRLHLVRYAPVLTFLLAFGRPDFSVAAESPSTKERPRLYDTQANGKEQVAAALKVARAEGKRVILKFGANW